MDAAACDKLISNLWVDSSDSSPKPLIDYRPTIILATIIIALAIMISAYMIVECLRPLFNKPKP